MGDWLQEMEGGVTAPRGLQAAGVTAGVKARGKDLALIYSPARAAAAGVFTTNRVKAAPVLLTRSRLARGEAHAVVVNSGNANACTGPEGYRDAVAMAELAAAELGVPPHAVLVASTGIIGQRLPMERLARGIKRAAKNLSPQGGADAARAIMTTDTRPKQLAVEFQLKGRPVRVGAMAKGAGMIGPHLATMLAVITTDALVPAPLLGQCLGQAVEHSFNCITVEGDTSPNDMVLLLANGQAEAGEISPRRGLRRFQQALDHVCRGLARAIAADGEGATKLISLTVKGAASFPQARQVALTVANSPLVKTAIFGGDPNWGRVLAAAGRAGVRLKPELLELWIGPAQVVKAGQATNRDCRRAARALAGPRVDLTLDLNQGNQQATVWTCDLTYGYIELNAEYHT